MVPALHDKHLQDNDLFDGNWPDRRVGLVIVIGSAAITGVLCLIAVASMRFGIGPRLPTIAYLLLGICGIMLLGNYMITLIRNETRAGLYLVGFWSLALVVLLAVLRFLG